MVAMLVWDDASEFQSAIRAAWKGKCVPCVLDLTAENAYNFGQGGVNAVLDDLRFAGLPEELQDSVLRLCHAVDTDEAYAVRRELINYKKVMHHIVMRVVSLERDLRQAAALLYCQQSCDEDTASYRELAQILQRCRGFQQACTDVRSTTRALCNLPRCNFSRASETSWHPFARALSQVRRALKCAANTEEEPLPAAFLDLEVELRQRLAAWPRHVVDYVHLCLVARGVDKALRIRDSLACFSGEVSSAHVEIKRLLDIASSLAANPEADGQDMLPAAVDAMRRHAFLEGMLDIACDVEERMRGILTGRRCFLAGDGRVNTLPRDWTTIPEALQRFEEAKERFTPAAHAVLKHAGWPPKPGVINCDVAGEAPCNHCGANFRPLWVHRGACFACAAGRRSEGRCPYRDCAPAAFCPHAGRCLACEEWSCQDCGLLRLDGEGVNALVEVTKPSVLFFDFCQTLATTKKGQAPRVGVHVLQPDLAELARQHDNVHVITRNSHVEEIHEFLAAQGLDNTAVHSVKRERRTKAECIADILGVVLPSQSACIEDRTSSELVSCSAVEGETPSDASTQIDGSPPQQATAVFVDDDLAELMKADLRSLDLCRVLFQQTVY